jgi:threonine/homoserine/homoserine lactone efflux protein
MAEHSLRLIAGEVLALALVVTISPLNIIPAILLLFTRRPRANALSFLAGFIFGIAALLALFVAIARAVDLSPGSDHGSWAGVVKLALGVYLVVAAVRKFRGRPKVGEQASMPKWMDGMTNYTPGKSLGAGAALGALNPKNVIVGLAAAVTVTSGDLSDAQQIAACAIYLFVAMLGVATPLLAMMLLGDRAQDVLGEWRTWLEHNSATVMSVLFLIFGVVLIGQGLAGV